MGKNMRKWTITCILLTVCSTLTWAVPANPKVLKALLEAGDTARYEAMIRHDRQVRTRPSVRPNHSSARRASGDFGHTPLLASRGLLILVNFSNKSFHSSNDQAQMDSMMNAYNYTYNEATGSAAQYFSDQSLGQYRPHFDVVGPITLPKGMSYYGANGSDGDGDDVKLGDMVLHACSIASQINGVDLSNYDEDEDGEMDFVYIIYAGYGEADGGSANTIWPASWDMASAVYYGYTSLSTRAPKSQYTFDGVSIGNFAYSNELQDGTGFTRTGIGTPTHEFSHVLGLPDLYDINYGDNYDNGMTPDQWDIMDAGSYNNDGRTPPNMSPWEKAFMGWVTPVNPGDSGALLTLYPNGSENYNVVQINASGQFQDYNETGVCYLLENRQQTGWDAHVPGHGMLIWRLDYKQSVWKENEPNSGETCLYTVVSASGKTNNIGQSRDPFPGRQNVTSWNGLNDRPLTNIREQEGVVTLNYMGGATALEVIREEEVGKFILNGQLYIIRDGKTYNALGQKLQ